VHERRTGALDKRFDALVHQLDEITDEEVRMAEEATRLPNTGTVEWRGVELKPVALVGLGPLGQFGAHSRHGQKPSF
jgi:hypothetical protein